MFLRIVKDSFARQPRRKLLTAAALALGTAMATATLSVALDVGDRLAREFRSLGANLLVTPQADTLPLEIGGVDYRPVDSGAYLARSRSRQTQNDFLAQQHHRLRAVPGCAGGMERSAARIRRRIAAPRQARVTLIGTWYRHDVPVPNDGGTFRTGISATNPWWRVDGRWFGDGAAGVRGGRGAGAPRGNRRRVRRSSCAPAIAPCSFASPASSPPAGRKTTPCWRRSPSRSNLSDRPGQYRRLLVSALTKPEDAFSQRDPATMTPAEYDRWYCSPYISSISRQTQEQLPGVDVRPIRQIAEGEGRILTRVSALMWLVTLAALLAAALAVAATAGTTVLERTEEIGLMKALGAPRRMVGAFFLGEQWLLALLGGAVGLRRGLGLARLVGERVFGVSPETRLILLPVVLGVAAAVATLGSLAAAAPDCPARSRPGPARGVTTHRSCRKALIRRME